jgi:dCMP deaminase
MGVMDFETEYVTVDIPWDYRFLNLARLVSSWSKDESTKVGSVIVRPDKTVAGIGYNGFPRKMPDNKELYENREEKYSRIIHAEINALLHTRENVKGYTLYGYPLLPCDRCFVQLVQAGITRFIAPMIHGELFNRWNASLDKTRKYAKEMSVEVKELSFDPSA